MTKGLRLTLWMLSSLAVIWTVLTVLGLTTVAGMQPEMGDQGTSGMTDDMMRGGATSVTPGTIVMMLYMLLTPIVMLGLDGVFIYLAVTPRRPSEEQTSASFRRAA